MKARVKHRHPPTASHVIQPSTVSHTIQPIPESERELVGADQEGRIGDPEMKSIQRGLRGPPTAASMEQSVLTDAIRSNLSAHIIRRSGSDGLVAESVSSDAFERTASMGSSNDAFECGQISDTGVSPQTRKSPTLAAQSVMRGNSNRSDISSATSRRRESTSSLIVRRGSMTDGGMRGSRSGEKAHDVFSRTKQKVKALIEAHKLLLVEDLQEMMSRSSQAIYDAVVVR